MPYDGQEPPATVSDELAMGVWCAVSALWHPSLLARAAGLPRIESVDSPSPPGRARSGSSRPGQVIGSHPDIARKQRTPGRRCWIRHQPRGLIAQIQARVGTAGALEMIENEGMTTTAQVFLALGTVRWMLRELTAAMGHADALDQESLTRELLTGAHAWQIGDWASASTGFGPVSR